MSTRFEGGYRPDDGAYERPGVQGLRIGSLVHVFEPGVQECRPALIARGPVRQTADAPGRPVTLRLVVLGDGRMQPVKVPYSTELPAGGGSLPAPPCWHRADDCPRGW